MTVIHVKKVNEEIFIQYATGSQNFFKKSNALTLAEITLFYSSDGSE